MLFLISMRRWMANKVNVRMKGNNCPCKRSTKYIFIKFRSCVLVGNKYARWTPQKKKAVSKDKLTKITILVTILILDHTITAKETI